MSIEIIKFSSLSDVATSHDVSLRKWVLAAAGKYPEGRMVSLKKYSFAITSEFSFSPSESEILLLIPNNGKVLVKQGETETEACLHDLVTIRDSVKVSPSSDDAAFYLVNWQLM